MNYNFDEVIERKGSGALKYDALKERYGNPDLLPLWVADMDFATPSFIMDALKKRLEHPVLGYTVTPPEFKRSIVEWVKDRHCWHLDEEWITYIPGIVKGIGMVINLFTNPGDKIIIQPPVYHPFRLVPEGNCRQIVNNPLILETGGSYSMDLEHLETIAKDPAAKILILSNPHNPAGIVWDKLTLQKVADICNRNGVLVISDEIHCDMTLWGNRHIPFATVSKEAASNSITFQAPSKTFNIAGVVSSYAVVPDDNLRHRFYSWLDANEFSDPGLFPPIATVAAFTRGNEWREEMLRYVEGNIDHVIEFCKSNIPAIRPLKPDASFLVWLDCRDLNLSHDELIELFEVKAQLALNDGSMFGPGGSGFMRMNVGAPRAIVNEALQKLLRAVKA